MINLQDAWKRTMNTLGNSPMGLPIKTSGTIFNAMKKLLKTQATPSLNYTPMSTSALQAMITPKTNTQDVKSSTLSQPKYNPTANVVNENLMNNYTGQQTQTPTEPVLPQVSTPIPTMPTPTPVESEADKWFKMYQQSMAMTPQEEALQNQLSNLTTGADLGVAGLEGQGRGIPLSLVRGQQEKLLKQAAIQTQPLQKQLELLQAKRQAQMEGAKAGMDYFKEESQAFSPMKVGAGETLIDPRTGQTIYQGQAEAPSITEQYGSGIIGEYNFAKAQGYPGSFIDYQNEDANRKKSIAASTSIADASGLTTKQNTNFMAITNKFQADKTIGFAEKGSQTMAIADQVLSNPKSAVNQLKTLYSLVKALDPESAVREGELDLATSTQSYLEQWQNTLNKISRGVIVNEKTAIALAQATKDLAQEWYKAGRNKQKQYQAQAQVAGVGDAFNEYLGMYEQPYMQETIGTGQVSSGNAFTIKQQ